MHRGSCLCGTVRYEVDGDLPPPYLCHCQRCRKAHGGAFAAVITVPAAAFRFVGGEEMLGDFYQAESTLHRVFCKNCGSPILSRRDTLPDLVRIRAGSLDTPYAVKPASHIFVGSKADWFDIRDTAPQYAERAS
ncbi:MAG: GFA family protein [Rudaea sp.]|uniref:GFA family protein n=1 Tax=unclassified Rudaea TaxID=2627037 RepID=UPI0010F70B62|nr:MULTISPECIES: GFA family protein [unclassified Rudaea]MBN8884697.1 GFA family protein [Rudaea sp.]MBR0343946.1 GFA family protein [Rudaea sp.]